MVGTLSGCVSGVPATKSTGGSAGGGGVDATAVAVDVAVTAAGVLADGCGATSASLASEPQPHVALRASAIPHRNAAGRTGKPRRMGSLLSRALGALLSVEAQAPKCSFTASSTGPSRFRPRDAPS